MVASSSSTTSSAGWEQCYHCNAATKQRLSCRCIFICRHCAEQRPACVMCTSRVEVVTDTTLRSNEEFEDNRSKSSRMAVRSAELAPLHRATMSLEKAREYHEKAFLQNSPVQHWQDIYEAHRAAEESVRAFESVPMDQTDQGLLAQALLLQANTVAKMAPNFKASTSCS